MKTLVVGWGNPIAGDDAVGLEAAETVAHHMTGRADVDVITTSHGGYRLAERSLGYASVLVLDAHIGTANEADVSIARIDPADLDVPSTARHDGSLVDAFRALRALDANELPKEIVLISVPIEAPTVWSEAMSPAAHDASRRLAGAALRELEGIPVG